ncbi:hypothetical protein [Treponema denticola]|uniref:hypothetical protein n=1 Tax=Treponema denticola TaxID=158 RepID=UPI00210700C3|nr:hypothetical protein [Treponema denticola]
MDIGNDFSRTEHSSRLDKGAEYADKCKALLKFGEDVCPIKIIEDGEQAQRLVNEKEFTVFALWRNPEAKKGLSSHIAVVVEDKNPYDPAKGPLMGNVGWNNGIIYQNERAFGKTYKYKYEKTADGKPKSIDKKIIYVYDVTQTGKPDTQADGFCGIAHNFATGKQSISIHDPNYDENEYMNYKQRTKEEDEYIRKLKEERLKELKSSAGFSKSEISQFDGFLFFTPMIMEYAENTASDLNFIDTRADDLRKVLRNNNTTLLSAIKKGDKNVADVLLGRITAGNYIEQKKAERAAQEKAEAEAKRIAEEKSAKEKAEKERQDKEKLAREDEERRRKEGGNNPSSNPKKPDEDRSEPILDEDDRSGRRNKKGEEPIKSPPKNDGGNKTTQPTTGSGGSSTPPAATQPSQGGGNGVSGGTSKKTEGNSDGSKPKPPKIPKPGDMIPLSIDTNNEYYLGSLYGTKPFSAQESSAFNSTIISNELSALQPITSLNVAGLPVNDTAIKEDPFGV